MATERPSPEGEPKPEGAFDRIISNFNQEILNEASMHTDKLTSALREGDRSRAETVMRAIEGQIRKTYRVDEIREMALNNLRLLGFKQPSLEEFQYILAEEQAIKELIEFTREPESEEASKQPPEPIMEPISELKKPKLKLIPDDNAILIDGSKIELRAREYELINHMLEKGQCSTPELATKMYGETHPSARRSVTIMIHHIRKRLEDANQDPNLLRSSMRGRASRYWLDVAEEEAEELHPQEDAVGVTPSLKLISDTTEVIIDDQKIHLTPSEWSLLSYLHSKRGERSGTKTIIKDVFGSDRKDYDRFTTSLMTLRKKLGESAKNQRFIRSENRGRAGSQYWLETGQEELAERTPLQPEPIIPEAPAEEPSISESQELESSASREIGVEEQKGLNNEEMLLLARSLDKRSANNLRKMGINLTARDKTEVYDIWHKLEEEFDSVPQSKIRRARPDLIKKLSDFITNPEEIFEQTQNQDAQFLLTVISQLDSPEKIQRLLGK